jgi:hypothetical protein
MNRLRILNKMKLSNLEIEYRDGMIEKGISECRSLLGKQERRNMYFFYEGSLDGFEECRKFDSLESYVARLEELRKDEMREISCSSLRKDDKDSRMLRESLGIYGNEKTDEDRVWRLKGIRTQVEFVYERLAAFNLITRKER